MGIRWILAAVHLLALGIGLGAIWARSRALRGPFDPPGLRRTLAADGWWGMAAVLWIVTGLLRAFAGYEKGAPYYLHNKLFLGKLTLLAVILLLELQPMAGLIGWRRAIAQGTEPDTTRAMRWHRISQAQAFLIVLMLIAATGMARGFGAPGR